MTNLPKLVGAYVGDYVFMRYSTAGKEVDWLVNQTIGQTCAVLQGRNRE
jgi:hypothetical protein